jgi:hypothetical protein
VGARSTPLVEGEALAPGSRIVARPGGHAILAFATGTRLTVEDEGDVTLVDGGPTSVIAVARGSLRADVAKLHAHERFLVRTDDAEVEVRGTSFRVSAGGACDGAGTRVEVYEGVVVVRHGADESRVAAGESWQPQECAPTPAPAAQPRPAKSVAPPRPHGDTRSVSALRAQNDLFAAAVAAKQSGDTSGAAERFDEFVTRWPGSALAESAAAQRMKLLHASGSRRAADAARAYLARWPEGFARAEAEGIVAGTQ